MKAFLIILSLVFLIDQSAMAASSKGYTPITDDEIKHVAIFHCKNVSAENVNTQLIANIIEIEKKYEVPDKLRGMLLASACMESGYNPNAEGDHRFHHQRRPKAIGLFQMWPWWESTRWGYGIDRRSPLQSAEAYILHIKRQLKKIRTCNFRSTKKRWIAAWVRAIRAPKPGGRCNEKPNHLRLLKRWHKRIFSDRQQ